MSVGFQVQLKIRKPAAEVFDAVVDPQKLAGYFVKEASGPLVAGQTVMWSFPEFDGAFPVEVVEVLKDERIVLAWDGDPGRGKTRIEMVFKPMENPADTMVQISEAGWVNDEAGLKASHGNAGGWMHMMMGLKASLEYGINLREGGAL
jgi:uncharacterized protein YndB with AHSA1/START domain